MNLKMKSIATIICACLMPATLLAQIHTEKITKEFAFEKKGSQNAVLIFNISGDVKVTGYAGDKVLVEVEKIIRAKTEARLEKGKAEVQLGVLDRADSIMLYMQAPCHSFGKSERKNRHGRTNGWGYDWDNCCNRRDSECNHPGYDYELNFTIKVPNSLHVSASTVNDGNVVLENVSGTVIAENVNGSIRLTNIAGPTYASTINGDVDLDYSKNPNGDSRYYSLNGDINANFIKGLAANVAFESFNGNLYTNIEKMETLPATMKEAKKAGEGIRYKIGGNRYKVGAGGVLLDFETFNGNAYIKEK
jgi:hypothetical protein